MNTQQAAMLISRTKPVKERPISFNAAMAKAVAKGFKTHTRRQLAKVNGIGNVTEVNKHQSLWHMLDKKGQVRKLTDDEMSLHCPFGQHGDRLWVREPWQYTMPTYPGKTKNRFAYVANDDEKPLWIDIDGTLRNRWLPGFMMPKEACRMILEITEIGVEHLNEISDQDVFKEGVRELPLQEGKLGALWSADPREATLHDRTPQGAFKKLWNSLGGNWTDNPLVWVISFRLIDQSR